MVVILTGKASDLQLRVNMIVDYYISSKFSKQDTGHSISKRLKRNLWDIVPPSILRKAIGAPIKTKFYKLDFNVFNAPQDKSIEVTFKPLPAFYFQRGRVVDSTLWGSFSALAKHIKINEKELLSNLTIKNVRDGIDVFTIAKDTSNRGRQFRRNNKKINRIVDINPLDHKKLLKGGIELNPGPMNNKNNTKKMRRKPRKPKNTWLIRCYGPFMKIGFQGNYHRTTLKYVETLNFSVSALSFADHLFRANSVFDPNSTGTGGQPLGFDTLSAIYNRYRVNSYRYHVEMMSVSVSYKGACALVNGNETPTSLDEIIEYPLSQLKCIGFSGSPTGIFTRKEELSHLQGKSQISYHSDDLTGAIVNTNPTEVIDLHVAIQNDNASTLALFTTCIMWYDVIFYDPIIPVRSFKERPKQKITVGPNQSVKFVKT